MSTQSEQSERMQKLEHYLKLCKETFNKKMLKNDIEMQLKATSDKAAKRKLKEDLEIASEDYKRTKTLRNRALSDDLESSVASGRKGEGWHVEINNYVTSRSDEKFLASKIRNLTNASVVFAAIKQFVDNNPALKAGSANEFFCGHTISYTERKQNNERANRSRILDLLVWREKEQDLVIFDWKFFKDETMKKAGAQKNKEKEQMQTYMQVVIAETRGFNINVSGSIVFFNLTYPDTVPLVVPVTADDNYPEDAYIPTENQMTQSQLRRFLKTCRGKKPTD